MGDNSNIEWTDATLNVASGCTKVSPACDHCLDPATRVLMRTGSWKPLADVRVGDELLSCTEEPQVGANRALEVAVVEAITETVKPTVTIATAGGRTVTASPDHRFLSGVGRPKWVMAGNLRLGARLFAMGDPRSSVDTSAKDYMAGYVAGVTDGDGTYRWDPTWRPGIEPGHQVYWRVAMLEDDRPVLDRVVQYLREWDIALTPRPHKTHGGFVARNGVRPMLRVETRVGDHLALIGALLEPTDSKEWKAGWLAGFLDTDGSTDRHNHRWTQVKDNGLLDRTLCFVEDLGFSASMEKGDKSVRLNLPNGLSERVEFIGAIQPALPRKALDRQIGTKYMRDVDEVVRLEAGQPTRLIDITTSTGTFVAEGLTTHNCYIDRTPPFRIAGRKFDGEGVGASTDLLLHPERLHQPLRWRRPRRVFVNSLSDVFHEQIEDSYLVELFAVMALSPRHTFQVLTKRHGRMRSLLSSPKWTAMVDDAAATLAEQYDLPISHVFPLPNVWLGVTVEDQKWADIRIPALLRTPAAVRFLSCEPLLGPVSLHRYLPNGYGEGALHNPTGSPLADRALPTLDWVITGGESGPKARPTNPEWVRTLRDQCTASGVAYFFKQWGEWAPDGHFTGYLNALGRDQYAFDGSTDQRFTHTVVRRVGKKNAGRLLDGRTWDEMPSQGAAEAVGR